jgi:hypothetical protein
MYKAVWGLIIAASLGLLVWNATPHPEAAAQRPLAPTGANSNQNSLIALGFEQAETPPLVVVVDPNTNGMSVYHIDRTTGEITLKSVRNVRWDLQMEEFNGVNPTPQDIRSLLERR